MAHLLHAAARFKRGKRPAPRRISGLESCAACGGMVCTVGRARVVSLGGEPLCGHTLPLTVEPGEVGRPPRRAPNASPFEVRNPPRQAGGARVRNGKTVHRETPL